ncbi:MAG: class I mannose-6-phosphate isomerase [Bacteroidales bacterium]|nr:class I mannose-6-phosphate isomerase [Bacteroidales bacterium]
MEKKLYPMTFLADSLERHWGEIVYKLADLGFMDTTVAAGWFGGNTLGELMQTYLERVVGDTAFEYYGTQFPVMVKFLDIKGRTSLHVNPDDQAAGQRYDAFGKTALWYVAEAGPGAELYLGFKRDVTASEFYGKCQDGTVGDLLNVVHPKVGDAFLITPGLVHAAGGGVKIIEISESSDLFFRVADWGREFTDEAREMHLEEAFDLIDFKAWQGPLLRGGKLAQEPQFAVSEIRLADPIHIFPEQSDSFLVYVCAAGEAMVQVPAETAVEHYPLYAGEVILVPAELKDFFLVPADRSTVLLEVMMGKQHDEDSYIDSSAEPGLDEEDLDGMEERS